MLLFIFSPSKRGKIPCWDWSMGKKSVVRERESLLGYYHDCPAFVWDMVD